MNTQYCQEKKKHFQSTKHNSKKLDLQKVFFVVVVFF